MCTTQSPAQFRRELLVATAASGALVVFVEFTSGAQWGVAHGASEVVYAPSFVQCGEYWEIKKQVIPPIKFSIFLIPTIFGLKDIFYIKVFVFQQ